MNPLTNMKNVLKLSEHELKQGACKNSWHDMYHDSAWIFVAGFPYTLSEGDLICVFSQYGEIVNINLVREKDTGKSKGFSFICYEDQRSTILAVDNLNGIKILNRSVRVDHVSNYKPPKENDKMGEETLQLYLEGCAPKLQISGESIKQEQICNVDSQKHMPEKISKKHKELKHKKENKSRKNKKTKRSKTNASSSYDIHSE